MTTETKQIKKVKSVPKTATVTLCMIVKNESHIIKECLESMIPYIDRYDITDTGSDDGTPELIKEFMDEYGIPGEVYLSDWKGFGDGPDSMGSRTESFKNANGKADYAWVIDADDFITGDFKYPAVMDKDAYSLRIGREDFIWWRNQIFRLDAVWHYVGVLHEYAACQKENATTDRINGNYRISARTMGARNIGISVVDKYTRDADALYDALNNPECPHYEPNNSRYQFYLAQSYFDSQQWVKSEEAYLKRAGMGGWEEECYYSLYRVALLKAIQDKPWIEIKEAFLDAWESRPIRAEPLYQIARLYRQVHDRPRLAYLYAKMALEIPYPKHDILFISDEVYKYQILDEISATAFYAGKPHVGYHASKRLIDEKLLPNDHVERIKSNMISYEKVVAQIHQQEAAEAMNERVMFQENKRLEKEDKRRLKKEGTKKDKKGTKSNQKNSFKKRKKNK
ncbi:hypothetical protein CL614_08225 [archaeon]|nr:hypothetical protein [archaeon]|tara:strand:- start:1574 stop:2935 length:1362 start_codon:yes stop_codon:yes gene_type:complete